MSAVGIALAVALRLVDLGGRPLHHDESLDAWWAWRLATGRGYQYDPVYHGPLRIIITAGLFRVFGDTDTVARVLAAVAGLGLVATPLLVRRALGGAATAAAMVCLALSPSLVYFGRFGREDIPFAAAATVAALVLAELLRAPRRWHPIVLAAALVVAATIKETIFITGFVLVTYLLAVAWWERRSTRRAWRELPMVRAFRAPGARAWWAALALFATVFTLAYTVGFTDLPGLPRGLFGGLDYWLGQHEVRRGGQPASYYAVLLVAYEWPIVLLAVVGLVRALRRPTYLSVLLVWLALSQLVIYSWAGERYPWLVVHPLVPLTFLAGVGFGDLWERRRQVAPAAAAVALLWMVPMAVRTSHVRETDPRELLVAVQASPEVRDVVGRLERLQARSRSSGRPAAILVDQDASGAWPLGWYLREVPGVGYQSMAGGIAVPFDAAVVAEQNLPRVPVDPARFEAVRFPLWQTWLPDYGSATPSRWWRWFWKRETWNEPQASWMWAIVPREDVTG